MTRERFTADDSLPRPETCAAIKWWADMLRDFIRQPVPDAKKVSADMAEAVDLARAAQRIITVKKITTFENTAIVGLDAQLKGHKVFKLAVSNLPDKYLLTWLLLSGLGLSAVAAFAPQSHTILTPGKVIARAGTKENSGREVTLALVK